MIAVVIPSYRVKDKILKVIESIGEEVQKIYIVDDECPEKSGEYVQQNANDSRVEVIFHEKNMGVGGAVVTGYKKAIEDNCSIVLKIDGDDQMDTSLIPKFIEPIEKNLADYTKGNRFFYLKHLNQMPFVRLFGNSALSFVNKFSSGYWDIMDPTNGYTAVRVETLKDIELEKLSKRYFFESDMLFRLNIAKAVVKDVKMQAKYDDEKSSLSVMNTLFTFPSLYWSRFLKRVFYNYFLRDFNIASVAILIGPLLLIFGAIFGGYHWFQSALTGQVASAGTVMIPSLSLIVGLQLILLFLQTDINSIPKK